MEVEEVTGSLKASSTWALLIGNIKIDPLRCKKCGGEMKIIAFVTDFHETKKILKHTGEETQRAPPLSPNTVLIKEPDDWYADYIPSDEVYFQDEDMRIEIKSSQILTGYPYLKSVHLTCLQAN